MSELFDLISAHLLERIEELPPMVHEEDDYNSGAIHELAELRESPRLLAIVAQYITDLETKHAAQVAELRSEADDWKLQSKYNYDCGVILWREAERRAEGAEEVLAEIAAIPVQHAYEVATDTFNASGPVIWKSDLDKALKGRQ